MSQKRQKENPRKVEFMRKYNREKLKEIVEKMAILPFCILKTTFRGSEAFKIKNGIKERWEAKLMGDQGWAPHPFHLLACFTV